MGEAQRWYIMAKFSLKLKASEKGFYLKCDGAHTMNLKIKSSGQTYFGQPKAFIAAGRKPADMTII